MPRKWESTPGDAISLAAFRWLANALENGAIELYATDHHTFKHTEAIMRAALKEMMMLKVRFGVALEDNGCPDGYVLCNGVCAPSCELLAEAQAEKT